MEKLTAENRLFVMNAILVAGLVVFGLSLQKNNADSQPMYSSSSDSKNASSGASSQKFLNAASDMIIFKESGGAPQRSAPATPAQKKKIPSSIVQPRSHETGDRENE